MVFLPGLPHFGIQNSRFMGPVKNGVYVVRISLLGYQNDSIVRRYSLKLLMGGIPLYIILHSRDG